MTKIEDIVEMLNRIYNISSVPFVLFSKNSVDFYYNPSIPDFYFPNQFLHDIFSNKLISNFPNIICPIANVYIGIFSFEKYNCMVGPITINDDSDYIEILLKKYNCNNISTISNIYYKISPISIKKFSNILSIFFEICTGINISADEIIEKKHFSSPFISNKSLYNFSNFDNEIGDLVVFESNLFYYINTGNIDAIDKLRKTKYPQILLKNHTTRIDSFTILPIFSIMTRAAIQAGANIEKVYILYNSALQRYYYSLSSIELVDDIFLYAKEFCKLVQNRHSSINRPDICLQIERYILWNLNENITLKDISNYCKLSERQIQRIFSKYFKCTFKEYILELKIKQSKTLLLSTNLSISDISSTLGFASQSYFTKRFQLLTGQTPSDYRSNHKL